MSPSRPRRDSSGGSDGSGDQKRSGRNSSARESATNKSSSRRGTGSSSPRQAGPPIPDEITGRELSKDIRDELRGLNAVNAEQVAQHLVMAGMLIEEDPETAYEHARAAQRSAGRIASVRETLGLAAYRTGRYAEALSELRAARRMSGSLAHLPVMADCERGIGRPERALSLAGSPEVGQLDTAGQVEMRIVAAGARRDLGQVEAAVITLHIRDLNSPGDTPWLARLRYAYADALLAAGRESEAHHWFTRASQADPTGETDAVDRLTELEGVTFIDALDAGDADLVLPAE